MYGKNSYVKGKKKNMQWYIFVVGSTEDQLAMKFTMDMTAYIFFNKYHVQLIKVIFIKTLFSKFSCIHFVFCSISYNNRKFSLLCYGLSVISEEKGNNINFAYLNVS